MDKFNTIGQAAGLMAFAAMLFSGGPALSQKVEHNPLRDAYFGETHIHSSWSTDAFIFNVRVTPEDAYKHALGKAIPHVSGKMVKLKRPLDFFAMTDHSEYMGLMQRLTDPRHPLFKHRLAKELRSKDSKVASVAFQKIFASVATKKPFKEFVTDKILIPVWRHYIKLADRYNQPGKFTTFAAYEWSSIPNGANLHRNIIFLGTKGLPKRPYTAIDSDRPENLWNWMDKVRATGIELLAIPHNSNVSNGRMFPLIDSFGNPITAAWARQRMRNEPILEVTQIKGDSETHPLLSPNDEFANFETLETLLGLGTKGKIPGSYAREAYRNGLGFWLKLGVNPYKFGLIGASDSHNSTTPVEEWNFTGKLGVFDGTPQARLGIVAVKGVGNHAIKYSASGLGGVWAESNTRQAIFAAMRRKETFATTGPRMRVRLFGGWNYKKDVLKRKDWVRVGYRQGVSMGGDLPRNPGGAKAPTFIVWAIKDPDSGNLDRIQIVKGWTKNGQTFEKIYNVALSGNRKVDPRTGRIPHVGNTVNLRTATYKNSIGARSLSVVWTDQNFDPTVAAFYYVRVLEIPTPRWSTYDAVRLKVALPHGAPPTIQERAYTSPIWFTPSKRDAELGLKGAITEASLKAQGVRALGDAEIKKLLVGWTLVARNRVTGEVFEALYGTDGKRELRNLTIPQGGIVGFQSMHGGGRIATIAPYKIKGGQLITTFNKRSFAVRIYKLGNNYYGARNNEFGFVNYELVWRN